MIRRLWALLRRAGDRFFLIEGAQRARALAYSTFASLFPMILLFVTAASYLIDRDRAGRAVIGLVESYVPMSEDMRRLIFATIYGMAAARGRAGAAALLILVWVASQCFGTLIDATNRAWGVSSSDWWRLPLKSLALLAVMAGALTAGAAASTLLRLAGYESPLLPMAMQFFGLSLFYRFAPRRRTRFAGVWAAVIIATLLLRAAENLFVIYLKYFAASNAVYGVFGGIMALLLWIYLSACIFIYGACLCAARSEISASPPFAAPPQ